MTGPAEAATVEVHDVGSGRPFQITGSAIDVGIIGALRSSGGYFEPHMMSFLARATSPGSVCMDIGANVGIMTVVLARRASEGRVLAFEPSAENVAFLRQNVAANDLTNVEVVQAAIGREVGRATLSVLPEHPVGSSLSTVAGAGHTLEEVELTTLDAFVEARSIDRLDVVKVDVEGSEPDLLDGAHETIRTLRPLMVLECNPIPLRVFHGRGVEDMYDRLAQLYGSVARLTQQGRVIPLRDVDDLCRRLDREGLVELIVGVEPGLVDDDPRWRQVARVVRDTFWRSRASAIVRRVPVVAARLTVPHPYLWRARVRLRPTTAQLELRPGATCDVPMELTNLGHDWFSSEAPNGTFLAYALRRDGELWGNRDDVERTTLAAPVGPRGHITTPMSLRAPGEPGTYTVVPTLVQESYAWLDTLGGVEAEPITLLVR